MPQALSKAITLERRAAASIWSCADENEDNPKSSPTPQIIAFTKQALHLPKERTVCRRMLRNPIGNAAEGDDMAITDALRDVSGCVRAI